jgi:Bacterial protein of unknown function (DUF839)
LLPEGVELERRTDMTARARFVVLALVALCMAAGMASAVSADTAVKPYLIEVGGHYEVDPLLSVGDRVPETSDPTLQYQMVGIPDGLAALANGDGTATLYMNHELPTDAVSEPVIGAPLDGGAFVSRFIVDADGNVVSGERAYDSVYNENLLVGAAPRADNATPSLGRFCSASMAGEAEGFDRPIYFTNEEAQALNNRGVRGSFDGRGGLSVAVFDNELHTLPKLGRFAKENTLVMRGTGRRTVIISLEDGPSFADSQLYMYVGTKDRSATAGVLARNGLNNGKLFVFASAAPGINNELNLQQGTIRGRWREIPNAENMGEVQLENAADLAGAFGFVRMEDGAFSKTHNNELFFVTTGGNPLEGNGLGRVYTLRLNAADLLRRADLHVVYNADHVIGSGADIAVSPDNIDTSERYLMVQEGGTGRTGPVLAANQRDLSVWRFDLVDGDWTTRVDVSSATRVAEVDPPGRDGVAVAANVWEPSGIIDASDVFGEDTWLLDVQAHPKTTPPAANTVEDGQLVLLRPVAQ